MIRNTLYSVSHTITSSAILILGNSLLFILISIYGLQYRYTTIEIAALTTTYFFGQLVGSFLCHQIITRNGYIRSFAIFVTSFSAISLLHSYNLIFLWFVARFVAGICMAGISLVVETWINDKATNLNRGQIFSIYMTVYYIALAGGQFLINIPFEHVYSYFFLVNIIVSLAIIPICCTKTTEPEAPQKIKFSFTAIYKKAPLGIIGVFVSGFANASFYGLTAIFAKNIGFTVAETSILTGLTLIGNFFLQWPLGRLSDILGRRQIILLISNIVIVACCAILCVIYFQLPLIIIYPLAILYGGGAFSLYSLCSAYTNDLVSKEEKIQASSSLIMTMAFAATLGPLISSVAMHFFPIMGLYSVILALHFIFSIVILIREYKHPLPQRLRGALEWVVFPSTSPIIAEVAHNLRSKMKREKKKAHQSNVSQNTPEALPNTSTTPEKSKDTKKD